MLRVLMYIIGKYQDHEVLLTSDPETIAGDLRKAGFTPNEIDTAFDWFNGVAQYDSKITTVATAEDDTIRQYDFFESQILSEECRGFLLYLEQCHILDGTSRELVIDRLLALQGAKLDVADVKWVALLVLFHMPNKRSELNALQDLVLFRDNQKIH